MECYLKFAELMEKTVKTLPSLRRPSTAATPTMAIANIIKTAWAPNAAEAKITVYTKLYRLRT